MMISPRVLALSSSRVGDSGYLEVASPYIKTFLGDAPLHIAFIPFAAADNRYDDYLSRTAAALKDLPYKLSVVKPENAASLVEEADAIMVGGGNTFKLLHDLYDLNLVELIQQKVTTGTPYVGWSAGANITGLTISTTNDMPIVEPKSFKAFGFFPFQINPHYLNVKPEGHNGETRDERLAEFLKVRPSVKIVGLPEGSSLHLEGKGLQLKGQVSAVLFTSGRNDSGYVKTAIEVDADLSYLL